MKFVEVKELPKRSYDHNQVKYYLNEFMAMKIKTALVEQHHYKSTRVAATCLSQAAQRHVMPIDVRVVDGQVYLIRRDM
jgi:hypothetical protein